MSRLDVHRMRTGEQGYVVDVQASLLSHLVTRVVVPLVPAEATSKPIGELNPVVERQLYRAKFPHVDRRERLGQHHVQRAIDVEDRIEFTDRLGC